MDMSDKLAAGAADELERDRERLKADSYANGVGSGGQAVSSIGQRLKHMFGAAAGASAVLGVLSLIALVTEGVVGTGLLIAMVLVSLATAAMAALSVRFVQDQLVHPVEQVCAAMRELAEGNREVYVPHEDRQDEIGAMARYLVIIKKAAGKFDRIRKEREEAEAEEQRRIAEIESEREQHRSQQAETIGTLADKFERTIGEIVGGVDPAPGDCQLDGFGRRAILDADRRRFFRPQRGFGRRHRRRRGERRVRHVYRRDQPPGLDFGRARPQGVDGG